MIETLYRTGSPEKGKSECYVLVVTPRVGTRRDSYSFMKEHGRWDDHLDRFVHQVTSINTEEGITHQRALALYETAKHELAQEGFVHSFVLDFRRKSPLSSQATELVEVTA